MTMAKGGDFDLQDFLPYLLNQAAETTSRGFQATYRARYGLTRTQWRVMANLGRFGAMTARDICRISHVEKTKVIRACAAGDRRAGARDVRVERAAGAEASALRGGDRVRAANGRAEDGEARRV